MTNKEVETEMLRRENRLLAELLSELPVRMQESNDFWRNSLVNIVNRYMPTERNMIRVETEILRQQNRLLLGLLSEFTGQIEESNDFWRNSLVNIVNRYMRLGVTRGGSL